MFFEDLALLNMNSHLQCLISTLFVLLIALIFTAISLKIAAITQIVKPILIFFIILGTYFLIKDFISNLGRCHHEWVIEDEYHLVCTKCGERHGMPYDVYRCH
jgi:hypothetical protein